MNLALKELQRTPSRFLPVTVAMTLLVVLLTVLGGFLDGLELSQTGSYRAQSGQTWAFSESSELQIGRSEVDAETREELANTPGISVVGQLSQVATTVSTADARQDPDALRDVIFIGYDVATNVLPEAPADGVVVDEALADLLDIAVGDMLLIGPDAQPVEIRAFVDDVTQGSPTIWTSTDNWRSVAAALSTSLPPEGSSQVVIIEAADGFEGAAGINAPDGIRLASTGDVVGELATVQQQSSTFEGIIGVTFVVTLIVVALFFALLTLERVLQYAVLKAIGASTRDLLTTLLTQAVVISAIAVLVGVALSYLFISFLPPDLPLRIEPNRLVVIAGGTVATALLGSLFTFRRINRIDPAEAIG